ncbi:MAG: SsrA-binding protein [Phycisphaerae bacterium]
MAKKPPESPKRIVNKKARHNFHVLKTLEAGVVLTGSEVKSLRAGQAQISEAFIRLEGGEASLIGAQIDRYPAATVYNHDPKRKRRLLLHRREIARLEPELAQKGTTLVPLSIYFNDRGLAKVEVALVVGKRAFDKRQDIKKREHQRDIDRAMSRRK